MWCWNKQFKNERGRSGTDMAKIGQTSVVLLAVPGLHLFGAPIFTKHILCMVGFHAALPLNLGAFGPLLLCNLG
ncbi:hypothetical protein DFS34DRAFT_611961 [Phlyctochytrium arcticum]|nr:hypothetical protein DFS34DRAFT_611961 [Phlyctochytrium arcticum]